MQKETKKEINNDEPKKKKKTNGKQKGKRGELELSHIFQKHGYNTRRSVQYNGKAENAKCDIIGLDGFHVECKRVEKLNVSNAMKQALRDRENGDIPIVCHRKSNEKWLVTIQLEDFLSILEKYYNDKN